jgi:hypothetical protein
MPVPVCGSRCAREGASSDAEMSPRARQNPLEGGVSHRARRNLLEGGVSPRARRSPLERGVCPRARRNPLEGGVCPRARRNLLEGAFVWATPVGREGHRNVARALCMCLSKRRALLLLFAGFKQDPPGRLGDPQGCPRQYYTHFVYHMCRTRSWHTYEMYLVSLRKSGVTSDPLGKGNNSTHPRQNHAQAKSTSHQSTQELPLHICMLPLNKCQLWAQTGQAGSQNRSDRFH